MHGAHISESCMYADMDVVLGSTVLLYLSLRLFESAWI